MKLVITFFQREGEGSLTEQAKFTTDKQMVRTCSRKMLSKNSRVAEIEGEMWSTVIGKRTTRSIAHCCEEEKAQ